MTFEQAIIVWSVVVPGCLVAAAAWVARRIGSPRGDLLIGMVWWVAVVVALAARQGWQWWPSDAWRQAIWPILGWAVFLSGSASMRSGAWRWVLAGVLASATALVAMPSGEQWSDTFDVHRVWMFAVTTSCLLNSFAVESMARRGAQRWCLLVALAGLAGPIALAAATYASLAEWALAVLVATLVVAVFGLLWPSLNAWVIAFPALAAAAGIVAAARFYSYEEYPVWIFVIALYGPAMVASVDLLVGRRAAWLRVTISAVASLLMVAACIWRVLGSST